MSRVLCASWSSFKSKITTQMGVGPTPGLCLLLLMVHERGRPTVEDARGRGQWLAFGIVLEKRIEYGRIRHFNN